MPSDRLDRSMPRRSLAMLVLLASSSWLIACGDDDDSTGAGTTAPEPPSAGLTVAVEPPEAMPGDTVDATVSNSTEKEFTYGADYQLDRVSSDGETEKVRLPNRPVPRSATSPHPARPGPRSASSSPPTFLRAPTGS